MARSLPSRSSHCVLLFALAIFGILVADGRSAARAAESTDDQITQIKAWVQQLGHDQYYRRESATRKLITAGPPAIPHLTSAMRSGDLEVVQRAVSVMADVASVSYTHLTLPTKIV